MSCAVQNPGDSFSEFDQLLNKIPLDTEDLDLVTCDHNESIGEYERLTIGDKALLLDEQVAKVDDSLLEFLTRRTRGEVDEEWNASFALSDDILPEGRKVSVFDLFIPGFSYKTSEEKENIKRVSWMMLLFAIVLVSSMVIVAYGEFSNVTFVSHPISCCCSSLRVCMCVCGAVVAHTIFFRRLQVFRSRTSRATL